MIQNITSQTAVDGTGTGNPYYVEPYYWQRNMVSPCQCCRWKYEAWWGIIPPCAGCPWCTWYPPYQQPVIYTTPTYRVDVTC